MLCCYVLTAVLLAPAAAPTPPRVHLERAVALESELEYERAEEELLSVITSPDATEDELVAANLLAGIVKRVLGNTTEARLHFLYVLKRRPETQLDPGRSPKIRAFFQLVREEVGADDLTDAKTLAPVTGSEPPDEVNNGGSMLTPRAGDSRNPPSAPSNTAGATDPLEHTPPSPNPAPGALGPTEQSPPPEPSDEVESSALPALVGGGVLAATGLTIAVASLGGAIFVDQLFFDGDRVASERETLRLVSRALVATTTIGTLAVAGGAGMMTLGAFE